MKKLTSLALVLVLMLAVSPMALADGTTTLTTTVPAAEYTLVIPADQVVPFNATTHSIGMVSVVNATGFAEGKNLEISISKTDFSCVGVNTTIPYTVNGSYGSAQTGSGWKEINEIVFRGNGTGGLGEAIVIVEERGKALNSLFLDFEESDWGKALGGDYTATITFTSEVVAE